MSAVIADLLKTINAYRELPRKDLLEIGKCCSIREYGAEQTVIAHGECSTTVFFVVSGSVRATLYTGQGREISYQDLHPGEMFGEVAALDQLPRATAVVTREPSTLISIFGEDYLALLDRYPQIARATMRKLAGMVRFLCDRVYNFGALDVGARVRLELARLAVTDGVKAKEPSGAIEIENMPRQQEIASRLATHREAISRELSALEKAGLIQRGKGRLLVLDLQGLQASIDT